MENGNDQPNKQTNKQVREGAVPLDQFVITRGLNRAPHEYGNAAAEPHVQVKQSSNQQSNHSLLWLVAAACRASY